MTKSLIICVCNVTVGIYKLYNYILNTILQQKHSYRKFVIFYCFVTHGLFQKMFKSLFHSIPAHRATNTGRQLILINIIIFHLQLS